MCKIGQMRSLWDGVSILVAREAADLRLLDILQRDQNFF